MCTVFLANQIHPVYRLIVAANRDEFLDRPTQSAHFWPDHPGVLAGRDLRFGGTWLGVSKSGRLAVLTNYREINGPNAGAPTRGRLPLDFLISSINPDDYLTRLKNSGIEYPGFNLIVGNWGDLWYWSNRSNPAEPIRLQPGVHGLSNALLNSPWPKVVKGKQAFREIIAQRDEENIIETLWQMMSNTETAPETELPKTGIPLEMERALSALNVQLMDYKTRSTAIYLVRYDGRRRFLQKNFVDGSFLDLAL